MRRNNRCLRKYCGTILSSLALLAIGSAAQAAMVGHWSFDDGSGATAVDAISFNDAVIASADSVTWTASGHIGGYATLGGGDDGDFRVAAIEQLDGATNLTISAWFRVPEGTIPNDQYKGLVMTRDLTPDPVSGDGDFYNYANWGLAYLRGSDGVESRIGTGHGSTETINRDTWYHVVLTWDAETKARSIYVNGIATDALPADTQQNYTIVDSGAWSFGTDPGSNARVFLGDIDDIAIWDNALTSGEVIAVYVGGLNGIAAPDVDLDVPPTFLSQPVNDRRVLGDVNAYVSFTVNAVGVAEYYWYYDNKDGNGFHEDWRQAIATYDDGGYEIIDVKDYYVVIESFDGQTSVTSDTVTVEEYLPEITEGDQSVEPGDTATMTIPMPDNGQTFVYQWYKDDTNTLAGATEAALTINDATFDDRGSYKVDVTWNGITLTSESVTLGVDTGMNRDLVGYWDFDETSGTTVADQALGNDAVWDNSGGTGLTWGDAGVVGTAANLGGGSSDRRFTVPNDMTLEALTMSGWVNITTASDNSGIFCNRTTTQSQWAMNMGASGDARVFNYRIRGATVFNSEAYATGQWYHLALVWDADTGERSTYLNGVQVSTDTNGEGLIYEGAGVMNFGDDNCCSSRELNGLIDEFAMWGRALTETEIAALYQGGLAGVPVPEVTDPDGPAHIQKHPVDQDRVYGDSTSTKEFSVIATGGEPLLYQWRADGVNIAGATTDTLAIADLVAMTDYDCVVSNPSGPTPGIETSTVARVVDYLPEVTPASQVAPLGVTTSFSIDMPAGPSYTYQWLLDDSPIVGAVSSELQIQDTAAEDAGTYTVQVDLPTLDPMTSGPATLSIITSGDVAFKNGTDEYDGTEDTTILTNNGTTNTGNFGGRNTLICGYTTVLDSPRTGLIRFKMDEYAGVFAAVNSMKLRLSLAAGSQHTNNTQSVTVKVYRVSTENADWVEGTEGGGATVQGVSCFDQKILGEADWNGSRGMETPGDDYVDDVLGEFVLEPTTTGMLEVELTASAFTLADMVSEWTSGVNGGLMLRCTEQTGNQIFWNSTENGDDSLNPELIMETTLAGGAPEFITQPADVDMILGAGDTVSFDAAVSGIGSMSYQWYYGNGAAIVGETESSLVFDPAETTDAGSYYLVVSNVSGTVQSDPAELTLILPELEPAAVALFGGGTVNYNLGLDDALGYAYDWKKGGVSIGDTNATLVISNATATSAGSYTVDVTLDSVTLTSSASELTVDVSAATLILGGNKTGSDDDVQDTELISWGAEKSFGGRYEFGCRVNEGTGHSAIKFPELETLDPGVVGEIKGAVLRLKVRVYYSGEESVRAWDNIQVRKILDTDAGWVEGNENGGTTAGNSTYNNKVEATVDWSSGSFGEATCEADILGTIDWATVPAGVDQIVDIPLNGDLSFIMDWISGDAPNSGFAVIAGSKSDGVHGRVDFYSSEALFVTNTTTGALSYPNAQGPQLILYYGAAAPEIVSIDTVDASNMELQWTSADGDHTYAVEATDDLVNGTWIAVATDIVPTPPMNTQTVSFATGMTLYRVVEMPPPPIFFDDFENGENGWITAAGGTGSGTVWELGTPDAQGSAGFDLTAASSPDNAWGTGIASGSYSNKVTLTLTSPMIDLSAETGMVTLSFMHALQLEPDSHADDYAQVKLLGSEQEIVKFEKMTFSDWTQYVSDPIDASSLGNVQVQFEFYSDVTNGSLDFAGWFIDDVKID